MLLLSFVVVIVVKCGSWLIQHPFFSLRRKTQGTRNCARKKNPFCSGTLTIHGQFNPRKGEMNYLWHSRRNVSDSRAEALQTETENLISESPATGIPKDFKRDWKGPGKRELFYGTNELWRKTNLCGLRALLAFLSLRSLSLRLCCFCYCAKGLFRGFWFRMKASVIEKLAGYAKRMENREDIFTVASPHMLPKTETFY